MTHTFKLERIDGTPADPPSFKTTVLAWKPGDTIPLSARRAWRNERASLAAAAVMGRRRLLALRSEGCRLPAFAAAPVRGCPAVYDVLPPMADRPLPEAPQVRCAHAPSLDGLRTL
jgi:hypothetical protein